MDAAALVRREGFIRSFFDLVPFNTALGVRIERFGDREALMRLPWAEHLVGNPETGVLHGGAVTAVMDACCGAAVFMALDDPVPIATLDLRIDYFKVGRPGEDILTRALCTKVTRNVAFASCTAYHPGSEQDPIAQATGSFMLSTRLSYEGSK